MICYRKATLEDLITIWDNAIAQNPGDLRYYRWKESYISRNIDGTASTFVVVVDDEPVGEVTLDYHADSYGNAASRSMLANGTTTAYVAALRIHESYEGQGLVSNLMHYMEQAAEAQGFHRLTIGVEATETRNLGIYLHWGYQEFVMSEIDGGALVLFYAKNL